MRFTRPDRRVDRQAEDKERAEHRANVLAALKTVKEPAVVALLADKALLKKKSTSELDLTAAKHGKIVERSAA